MSDASAQASTVESRVPDRERRAALEGARSRGDHPSRGHRPGGGCHRRTAPCPALVVRGGGAVAKESPDAKEDEDR